MKIILNICVLFIYLLITTFLCAKNLELVKNASYEKLEIKRNSVSSKLVQEEKKFTYADVLEKATASVVSVYTEKYVSSQSGNVPFGFPDFFREFGFDFPDIEDPYKNENSEKELLPYGAGSGVIIADNGYIVTNHHVVHDRNGDPVDKIRVRLHNEKEYDADLVGSDRKTDIAVLKISNFSSLSSIIVADSDQIRVGDIVFAIGNPFEVGITATQGIISAKGRHSLGILGAGGYEDFIQTDASINQGNSGGALIDAEGQLIGINTAIVSRTGGSVGIGFAIPINMVLNVIEKIVEIGEVPRGLLGIYTQDITTDIAEAFNLESTDGALVGEVQSGSPAYSAGIVHGDVIIQINDLVVKSSNDLRLKVSSFSPGTEVMVSLIREGKLLKIPVILGDVENPQLKSAKAFDGEEKTLDFEGLELSALNTKIKDSLSFPKDMNGVLVSGVDKDSPFSRSLRTNTIILEVNMKPVENPSDVEKYFDPDEYNRLYVWYKGRVSYLVIKY